jgi:hypothetical protein
MNIFRGIVFVSFAFMALFSSSHPPVNPGDFIGDIINELIGTLTCTDLDEKEPKKNLVGTWDMSLVSVTPEIPKIPVINPIKDQSTWIIIDSGNKLFISYDGSPKWYKEPKGITFTASRHYETPNSSKTACTFSGKGGLEIASLLLIYSDISVRYTDSVSIVMKGDDRITATIKVTVSGQYTEQNPPVIGEEKTNSINKEETIIYSGVRR